MLQYLVREEQKLTPRKRTLTIPTGTETGILRSIENKKEDDRKKRTRKKRPPPLRYSKIQQTKKRKTKSLIIDLTMDETPSPMHKNDLKKVVQGKATRKYTKATIKRKKKKTNYKSNTCMEILDPEANNNSSRKEDSKDEDWKPNLRRDRKKTHKRRIRKRKVATRVLRLKKKKMSMMTKRKDNLAKSCLDFGVKSAIAVTTESSILPTKGKRKRRIGKRLIKKKIPQQPKKQGDDIVEKIRQFRSSIFNTLNS